MNYKTHSELNVRFECLITPGRISAILAITLSVKNKNKKEMDTRKPNLR